LEAVEGNEYTDYFMEALSGLADEKLTTNVVYFAGRGK
jgi:hypothetical protein